MNDLTIKNVLAYACLWGVNALVVCLAAAMASGSLWGFGEGQFFAPVAASFGAVLGLLGSALAIWLAANRPRLGREDISALVGEVGALDARKILNDVLHGREGPMLPLTDDELDRMADRVYARIADRMRGAA